MFEEVFVLLNVLTVFAKKEVDDVLCRGYLELENKEVAVYFTYLRFLRFGDIDIMLDDLGPSERLKSVVGSFYLFKFIFLDNDFAF